MQRIKCLVFLLQAALKVYILSDFTKMIYESLPFQCVQYHLQDKYRWLEESRELV